jgi:hypothetical protein
MRRIVFVHNNFFRFFKEVHFEQLFFFEIVIVEFSYFLNFIQKYLSYTPKHLFLR